MTRPLTGGRAGPLHDRSQKKVCVEILYSDNHSLKPTLRSCVLPHEPPGEAANIHRSNLQKYCVHVVVFWI